GWGAGGGAPRRVRDVRGGESGADRERRDQVVTARVADVGQRIVLGADRHVQGAAAGAGEEGGGDAADTALHLEAPGVEGVRQPSRGALLLEGELGAGVDAAAGGEEVALRAGE